MEQVDTQALNRKLAEWVGFVGIINYPNKPSIGHPSPQSGLFVSLNFTNSLDACFKWLKSKFRSMACGSLNNGEWAWAKVILPNGESAWVREPDIDPALAICLAIEKVIDDR